MTYSHIAVMHREVIDHLNCRPGRTYVDGTVGGAGHARTICEKIRPDGRFIGLDQDRNAIANARDLLKPFEPRVRLIHNNFERLPSVLAELKITGVDGIVVDLGLSMHHIKESGRGFSFQKEEPLDMRMNVSSRTTAGDLINQASPEELADIFRRLGEERHAGRIARAIASARALTPIATSKQLADIVLQAAPPSAHRQRIHPATRVFMALRIQVNRELEVLENFMAHVADCLLPQGRLCVLTFHSLEDRIVKHGLKRLSQGCRCPSALPVCTCDHKPRMRLVTRKPMRPSDAEINTNPAARSAKLRVAEKI